MRKLSENGLYGIGVAQSNGKLLPKIKTLKKKKSPFVAGACYKDEKLFKSGDSNFLVSKDGLSALGWMDSIIAILLSNCMDLSTLASVDGRKKGRADKKKISNSASTKECNSNTNGVDLD